MNHILGAADIGVQNVSGLKRVLDPPILFIFWILLLIHQQLILHLFREQHLLFQMEWQQFHRRPCRIESVMAAGVDYVRRLQ